MSEPTTGQPSQAPEPRHPARSAPSSAEAAHTGEQHRAAVVRARAELDAGREWKARDRLSGLLAEHYDAEALDLLGEVNYAMRDLPAAGAAWFGTTRRGEDVELAIEAWRDRHSDHFAQMWRSMPRSAREQVGNPRVDALRRRAEQEGPAGRATAHGTAGEQKSGGFDAAVVIALAIAAFMVVCTVVGFITVLMWLVPG